MTSSHGAQDGAFSAFPSIMNSKEASEKLTLFATKLLVITMTDIFKPHVKELTERCKQAGGSDGKLALTMQRQKRATPAVTRPLACRYE